MSYLLVFGATSLCMHKLQYAEYKSYRKFKIISWSLLAVLLPSILAGMRSVYLGTDNTRYLPAFLQIARLKSPLQAINYDRFEIGYNLLSYIVSRFTTDYHWLCFVTEAITMSFIVAGLYYFRRQISLPLGMLAYLFLQYCNLINLVRQGIALAIVFYALKYVNEKNFLKFIFLIAFACMFHTSAWIGLAIYFVSIFMEKDHNRIRLILLIVGSFAVVTSAYYIASFLVNIGLFPARFLGYFSPGLHFSLRHTVFCTPVLLVTSVLYDSLSKKFSVYKYAYACLWCEIIIVQLADTFDPTYRMSMYFGYMKIILLPMVPHAFTKKSRSIAVIFVLIYLVLYWVYFTVLNKYAFVYPVYPYITDLF